MESAAGAELRQEEEAAGSVVLGTAMLRDGKVWPEKRKVAFSAVAPPSERAVAVDPSVLYEGKLAR